MNKKKNEMKNQREKKKPFFERVGILVTKRYGVILIVWLVIIAASVYPMLQLQKVLSYNELEFLPDNLEFHEGEAIFDELFPSNATGTTIIVIQSSLPISSAGNTEYIELLTERIFEEYNESIYDFQSPLTVLEAYNATYWGLVSQGLVLLNDTIEDIVNNTNQEMYLAKERIEYLWEKIASLYLYTWFNFSRTYYYGVYNTTLFSSGPDLDAYQTIELMTNYTAGMNITSDYVDLVYDTVFASLPDSYEVNDTNMNILATSLVNTTLYQFLNQSEGMAIQDYIYDVYPLLTMYTDYWNLAYINEVLIPGTSIINGTVLSENLYENSTLSNAYSSQNTVLNQLRTLNDTAFVELDTQEIITSDIEDSIDLVSIIEEFAAGLPVSVEDVVAGIEPLIPDFLDDIYELGPTPTDVDIINLTNSFVLQMLNAFILVYPPPETIDDIPSLFSKWVLSSDGKTSLILVSYDRANKTSDEIDEMIKTCDTGIGNLAHDVLYELNMDYTEVYHTGDQYVTNVWVTQAEEDARIIDIVTIVFVLVILLVIFTSAVAPLIPLIAIGSSILLSMAFLWFISFAMDIHFMSTLFLTVTSLGAGVDYCIFIFSRYNEERKKGIAKEPALVTAMKYAGESVFHSGLTVMVGFGALVIVNFPLLRVIGVSMIIGITMSILSAMLVVPSIIMLVGDFIWWPKFFQTLFRPNKWFKKTIIVDDEEVKVSRRFDGKSKFKTRKKKEESKEKMIIRFAKFITKNGLVITIVTFLISAPLIYFTFAMETSTDFMGMLPKDFEGTIGRDILSESMDVGDPTPINLFFYNFNQSPLEYDIRYDTLILINKILIEERHVQTIRSTVSPLGLNMLDAIFGPFADYSKSFVGIDNRSMVIEVFMDSSPYSKVTEDFVESIENKIEAIITDSELTTLEETDFYCLGYARGLYEIKKVTDNSFPIVIPVVVVGVYLVLFFLFGSYFTPIRLIITIALSIAITLGMLYLIFSLGFNVPIFWLLPLMLFSILMGLGLDYDIFLVSRIKEYYDKGMSNKEAIANALDHTASIITSCGAVMAAAYSSLLISQLWHLREIGFAFALAIILDATVIRLVVVPAIMVLLEKLNWVGPKKLMRMRHHKEESNYKKEG
jgi:RND superfamily putative drug exporter